MRKLLEILTPENVFVEYELAGVGSRFAAAFIDYLIIIIFDVLIYYLVDQFLGVNLWIETVNSIVLALEVLVLFFINTFYFTFFEMVTSGQSPGKKLVKLRVIKQNGEPIGFFDSFLRTVVRIIDILPVFYFVGTLFVLFNKEYKRIGDIVANTVVIKVKKVDALVTVDGLLRQSVSSTEGRVLENMYPVSDFEYSILKEFLERKYKLGMRRDVFAYHLNKYFKEKFHLDDSNTNNPYMFFEEIVRMNSGVSR